MPHILIVEDEPTTSWALAQGLSDDGYTIDTFRTAEEALTWLRGHKSDLVITDFRLPGLSGLELAQKGTFFEPSEEHGFVNGQVPFHKRVNRTLMRWCTARGDERRA